MLAITVALFALLAPYFTIGGARASPDEDAFVVDVGYQRNWGQAVMVRLVFYELPTTSQMHPSAATDPQLIRDVLLLGRYSRHF